MGLIGLLITIILIGLIFYILWWALSQIPLPEPFSVIVRVILVLVMAIIAIWLVLQLGAAVGGLHLTIPKL
jgi:hypothetical protein